MAKTGLLLMDLQNGILNRQTSDPDFISRPLNRIQHLGVQFRDDTQ